MLQLSLTQLLPPSSLCRLLLRLIELIYRSLTALQLQTEAAKKAQPKKQL